VSYTPAI